MELVTWNPSDISSGVTLSNGNLTGAYSGTHRLASLGEKTSGKWYAEFTMNTFTGSSIGIYKFSESVVSGHNNDFRRMITTGTNYANTKRLNIVSGDIVGIAIDMDNGILDFYLNGVINPACQFTDIKNLGSIKIFAQGHASGSSFDVTANFGSSAFIYPPPSGYAGYTLAPIINKTLILIGGEWKKYDAATTSWVTVVATPPTEADFLSDGMESLGSLTATEWALLSGLITIETYTDDAAATTKTLNETAVPFNRLVIPTGDINISNVSNIDSFTLNSNVSGQGVVKTVVSFDEGVTYHAWDGSAWALVPLTEADVSANGMTPAVMNAVVSADWDTLRSGSYTVRFAYLLGMESSTDAASTDNLISQMDMQGTWKHDKSADWTYSSNTLLTVSLYESGDYKINY